MTKIKLLFHREDGIRVSSHFGLRTSPITGKLEGHRGVDYATNGRKLPQYAIDNGTVINQGRDGTGALFVEVKFDKLGYVGQYYHLDSISTKLGQKVDRNTVIGTTGTTGNSTGIHLHFGWYPIKDINVSYFKRRWTDFESFDLSSLLEESKEDSSLAVVVDGFQKIYHKGQLIYLYKQMQDEEIGLISTDTYKELKKINEFDMNYKGEEIRCMVNASYFIMNGHERGQVLGREQSFSKDEKPEQMEWLDLVIDKNNKITSGNFASWEWQRPFIKLGLSYACCIMKDGYAYDEYSSAVGLGKLTNKNTQTLLMKNNECFYFAVIRGQMNGMDCREFAKAYGMVDCYMLDSGGSSQMLTRNDEGYITGREIPNVLCFYKKKNTTSNTKPTQEDTKPTVEESTPTNPIKTIGKITVEKEGLNLRAKLIFSPANNKPLGRRVVTLKVGDTVELLDFIPKLQIDGFQWVKVLYNGQELYCQYDSTCYTVELYIK